MVKGITRQVILVDSPDTKLFEQAIFILKDSAEEISDDMLLNEARRMINRPKNPNGLYGPAWAFGGALITGLIWLFSIFL